MAVVKKDLFYHVLWQRRTYGQGVRECGAMKAERFKVPKLERMNGAQIAERVHCTPSLAALLPLVVACNLLHKIPHVGGPRAARRLLLCSGGSKWGLSCAGVHLMKFAASRLAHRMRSKPASHSAAPHARAQPHTCIRRLASSASSSAIRRCIASRAAIPLGTGAEGGGAAKALSGPLGHY